MYAEGNIERIAVVGAFNMVYGAEQMCHLYPNLGLGCYAEDDETKLEMAVHQAMKDGNQAIVGDIPRSRSRSVWVCWLP